MKGISLPDGTPIRGLEAAILPIIGYQVEHKETGRLLPSCNRWEIYKDIETVTIKMGDVAECLDFVEGFYIWEYDIVPVREGDVENHFILI